MARRAAYALAIIAVLHGTFSAIAHLWISDDAYITYRYADNFVRGLGLVFNAGERVEGYTNFLWTLWIAAGIKLGANPETWSVVSGIVLYSASLLLLALAEIRPGWKVASSPRFPMAAVFAALHLDWACYATSGLETSLFTFLVLASYLLTVNDRYPYAGLLLGVATLTRPEGFIFAALAFPYTLWKTKDLKTAFRLLAAYLVIFLPFLYWRFTYYNDIFPNTYYAKSGDLSWYSQGWLYTRLYFQKYWLFLLGFALGVIAAAKQKSTKDQAGILLALLFTAVFTFYIIRLGGDFMFARMLIPITPLLALLASGTLQMLFERQVYVRAILLAAAAILFHYTAVYYSRGPGGIRGIVNEWFHYRYLLKDWEKSEQNARILRRYFRDLDVRLAYFGGDARLIYHLQAPVAVEAETGLTDSFTAHLPLEKRGRVGHEKKPPIDYLVNQRKLHFSFSSSAMSYPPLQGNIPYVPIEFEGVRGQILHWDSDLLAALKSRGARFVDFPASLDDYITKMDALPMEQIRSDYRMVRRFYFKFVPDDARDQVFACKLKLQSCKQLSGD